MRQFLARRPTVLAATVAGLFLALVLSRGGAGNAQPRPAAGASATAHVAASTIPPELTYRGERGTLYDVDWHVATMARLEGFGPQSTEITLVGVAQVTDLGPDGTRRLVGVRLTRLDAATLVALEQSIYPDLPTAQLELVGRPVVLALAANGAVEDVYLSPDTSPMAQNVLTALALHYGVTLPNRARESEGSRKADAVGYVATEPGDFGPVVWTYTPRGDVLTRSASGEGGNGHGEIHFEGSQPVEIASEVNAGTAIGEGTTPAHASAKFLARRRDGEGEPWARPAIDTLLRRPPGASPNALDNRASYLAVANGLTLPSFCSWWARTVKARRRREGI